MTENQTYLQSKIQHNVYSGFYSQDEILEIVEDEAFENIDESWVLS